MALSIKLGDQDEKKLSGHNYIKYTDGVMDLEQCYTNKDSGFRSEDTCQMVIGKFKPKKEGNRC